MTLDALGLSLKKIVKKITVNFVFFDLKKLINCFYFFLFVYIYFLVYGDCVVGTSWIYICGNSSFQFGRYLWFCY